MSRHLEVEKKWDEGLSTSEIAKELGLSASTIKKILTELGIPGADRVKRGNEHLHPQAPNLAEDVIAFRKSGATYNQISERFNISDSKASRILGAAGMVKGISHNKRVKRAKCCACGILLQYAEHDEVSCSGCSYEAGIAGERCTKKRKTAMMCRECQEFLNMNPLGAGNPGGSTEGGEHASA